MIYKNIEYDISEAIAQISLNRPEVGNTLNLELAKELYDATNRSFTNKKLKALILTGKGKLFCGGGDLKFLLANKKEVKKVLAKQDFDFLYDEKKGGLYFNENGADKGFGDGGIIAILKGAPDLTSGNLEFI